jgi:hypothetical protein
MDAADHDTTGMCGDVAVRAEEGREMKRGQQSDDEDDTIIMAEEPAAARNGGDDVVNNNNNMAVLEGAARA